MPRPLAPVLIVLLVISTAQHLLTPTLPSVSLQLDLTGPQLGLVFTISAVAVTLSSPLWGWALDALGVRVVLVAGLVLCLAGLAGHAAATTFGLDETLPPDLAYPLMLLFHGLLLGAGFAALPVAALAVAGWTGEARRTTAVGLAGAVQSLGGVIGPAAGGAIAVVLLLLPLYVATAIALAVLIWALVAFRPAVVPPPQPVLTQPGELVRAFGFGFLAYLSFGLTQVVLTFHAADRLREDAGAVTAGAVGGALAIGLVVTQGALVPVLRWPATRLMRAGAPVVVAGCGLLAVGSSVWLMVIAFLVLAAGLGFAVTGFAAAASLAAGPQRQGVVAGSVGATAGLTALAGPVLGGILHEVDPVAPVIAAGVAAALATVLALLPLRQVTPSVPQSVA